VKSGMALGMCGGEKVSGAPAAAPRRIRVVAAFFLGATAYLVPIPSSLAENPNLVRDATIEQAELKDLASGESAGAAALCPAGWRSLGGGVGTTGPVSAGLDYTVELSGPLDFTGTTANTDDGDVATAWYASVHNTSGSPQDFKVFALCSQTSDAAVQAEPINDVPPTTTQPGLPAAICAGKAATIVGTAGPDTLTGTAIADVIAGLGGNDIVKGLGAKDRICGGGGKDTLRGGPGADFLSGGRAADRIFGGPGPDRILGGPGNDACNGGPAADKLSGC
jgi:hypothetical protein